MKITFGKHGTRNTEHETQNAPYVSRFTLYGSPSRPAFTLIELLVVIAIMSILAALIIPIGKAVNRTKIRTKARGELAMLEMAIENYKTKMGHYPPDNPDNPRRNPLYFELEGTVLTNGVFQTLDGSGQIRMNQLPNTFGPKVTGIINSSQQGVGDEARPAVKFIGDLKPNQLVMLETNKIDRAYILVSSVPWPEPSSLTPLPNNPGVNPFQYNSSTPTNNPNSFDLWVDVVIDGKVNRVCNWSREPIIVGNFQ